jgi:hypothetical protein
VSNKDRVILAPIASFDFYRPRVGFMGPIKLVAEQLLCRVIPPCLEVVCWRDNEAAQDDGQSGQSLGVKTSSEEQGSRFDLVGIS